MGPRWPGRYFFPFEKRLSQPEIKSFDPDFFFSENLFLSKLLLILKHYFIIFGQTQYPKEHEKRRCRLRTGEIVFVPKWQEKWINNIAEKIIVINSWKLDGGRLHIFGKIKLSRPWIRLRVISYLCWFFKFENIRRCLAFSGEVHRWILKWHTKKWVPWYDFGSMMTILACNRDQLHKVCLDIWDVLLTFGLTRLPCEIRNAHVHQLTVSL